MHHVTFRSLTGHFKIIERIERIYISERDWSQLKYKFLIENFSAAWPGKRQQIHDIYLARFSCRAKQNSFSRISIRGDEVSQLNSRGHGVTALHGRMGGKKTAVFGTRVVSFSVEKNWIEGRKENGRRRKERLMKLEYYGLKVAQIDF